MTGETLEGSAWRRYVPVLPIHITCGDCGLIEEQQRGEGVSK